MAEESAQCTMHSVVRRKASWAALRVAAGSGSRLQSWSAKRVHLQRCTTVKESLAQVGDAPVHRAVPSASVESGYGRKPKVFCQKVVTNIATYNVRTLKAKWRQQELVAFLENKRIDACAIQEHRICFASVRRMQVADDSGSGGVGFLVSPIAFISLNRVEYKSDRVMRLQFSGHTKGALKTHLVCAYAPTNVADSATKDLFYSQLHQTIDPLPKRDRLFVLGDMNARLDSHFCKFPVHPTASDNGERMAEFMEEQSLSLLSVQRISPVDSGTLTVDHKAFNLELIIASQDRVLLAPYLTANYIVWLLHHLTI